MVQIEKNRKKSGFFQITGVFEIGKFFHFFR